jgi:hypothetical protein
MDNSGGALLPLAAGFRLKAIEARGDWQCHSGWWCVKGSEEEVGWP